MIEGTLINNITGVEVNYYFVCKKKLWYFAHGIQMEHESGAVLIGMEIQKDLYNRNKKEIDIGPVKIDLYKKDMIAEVKKSQNLEEAHIWQLKYYIYYLEKLGIHKQGVLIFVEQRKRIPIVLDEDSKEKLEKILQDIKRINQLPTPPKVKEKSYCKSCSYYKLCRV